MVTFLFGKTCSELAAQGLFLHCPRPRVGGVGGVGGVDGVTERGDVKTDYLYQFSISEKRCDLRLPGD